MVEVRQPTLGGAGRGWGPAANTGLGWPWLRSGSQHLARMAVVEVRRAGGGEEKEEEEEAEGGGGSSDKI